MCKNLPDDMMLMMMTSEPNQISTIGNEKDMIDRKGNQLLSNEWYSDSLSLKSILILLLFHGQTIFISQRGDIFTCNIE